MDWITWTLCPALGLTYVVVGSELTEIPRLLLQVKFPRTLGALVSCAPCSGFWSGLLVQLARLAFGHELGAAEVLLGSLGVTGVLWLYSASTGLLLALGTSLDRIGAAVANGPAAPRRRDDVE